MPPKKTRRTPKNTLRSMSAFFCKNQEKSCAWFTISEFRFSRFNFQVPELFFESALIVNTSHIQTRGTRKSSKILRTYVHKPRHKKFDRGVFNFGLDKRRRCRRSSSLSYYSETILNCFFAFCFGRYLQITYVMSIFEITINSLYFGVYKKKNYVFYRLEFGSGEHYTRLLFELVCNTDRWRKSYAHSNGD